MKSNTDQQAKQLLPQHRADLERSGLTDSTIEACGFYSEDRPSMILTILGRRSIAKRCGTALVIPFRDENGELNGFRRLKLDQPRKDRNGKPIKYESPVGQSNRVYVPPGTFPVLQDTSVELVVTEGEKKAAAADQEGFPCIGLVGTFGWKEKRSERLLPDLQAVEWNGRRVIIVFDSDLNDKPEVRDAESRLAAQLTHRGANVVVGRLPDGPDGAKQGVDDFLIAHDNVAFRKILDKAEKPDPVDGGTVKITARLLDSMREAERFLKQVATHADGSKLRFWQSDFWGWDDRRYRRISADEIDGHVRRWLDPVASHITNAVVINIISAVRALTIVSADLDAPFWLGKKPQSRNYIALQNGILDVEALLSGGDDVLRQNSPKWFSPVCLPYGFELDADCPKWFAFLDRNLEGDNERIELLQEWFGYCMTVDASLQKFLVLEGEGANGKSVVCAVLTAVLGTENVAHTPLEAFGQRFSLMPTLGKLANIASDVGEIDRVAEGVLKPFVSGDRLQFERKFQEPIQAIPTARIVLATNNRPRFSDRSGGLWRRMLLVPFNVTIFEGERVIGMDTTKWWEAQGELPGIFLWSLAGLLRLRKRGEFTRADVCDAALAEYRTENNPARLFLQEGYRTEPNGSVESAELYKAYRGFCDDNGYRALGERTFGKEVRRVFPTVSRRRGGPRDFRSYFYAGICEGNEHS